MLALIHYITSPAEPGCPEDLRNLTIVILGLFCLVTWVAMKLERS